MIIIVSSNSSSSSSSSIGDWRCINCTVIKSVKLVKKLLLTTSARKSDICVVYEKKSNSTLFQCLLETSESFFT